MTIPVWVEQQNGTFVASVVGTTGVLAAGGSRDAAVASLRMEVERRMSAGELVFIDVASKGVLGFAVSKYRDDPEWKAMWDDIKTQAYRERDEEKAREFPE